MSKKAKLLFMCGKMAAGKTTLSRQLAEHENALLLVEDQLLEQLYPHEIHSIADYVKFSSRLQQALTAHVLSLLAKGVSVVLDFPANTREQRAWFRKLFESASADHELHFVDASDDLCKQQLRKRSAAYPAGTPWTTEAEFDAITAYFQPPAPDEHFNVVHHGRE